MRVICQYTNHSIQIRPQRQRAVGDGAIEITQEPIYAQFQSVEQGAFLYDNEKEAAEKHFHFHGLTQLEDEVTPSDPIYRLSLFDTDEVAEREGWDAETKEMVENELRRKAARVSQVLLIVETTPIEAPFPAYDAYTGDPAQLVLKLVEDGYDLSTVLHYERTFGPKRPDIIEALEVGVDTWAAVSVSA